MNEEKFRTITLYKGYFSDFFKKQNQTVKDKILWTLRLIETQFQIPQEYFKHIEGVKGLYEIRIKYASDIFRIFCFFDEGKLIILANAFQKITQKTPQKEIDKAITLMKEYYEQKLR